MYLYACNICIFKSDLVVVLDEVAGTSVHALLVLFWTQGWEMVSTLWCEALSYMRPLLPDGPVICPCNALWGCPYPTTHCFCHTNALLDRQNRTASASGSAQYRSRLGKDNCMHSTDSLGFSVTVPWKQLELGPAFVTGFSCRVVCSPVAVFLSCF